MTNASAWKEIDDLRNEAAHRGVVVRYFTASADGTRIYVDASGAAERREAFSLTSLAGALAVGVFVLCLVTLYRVEWASLGIGNVDIGGWLLLVGGVLGLVGGFLGSTSGCAYRQARAAL